MTRRKAIKRLSGAFGAMLSMCVLSGTGVSAAEIVQNGSFENLSGPFAPTLENYMPLGNGSTFISGWTVSTSSGAIVLGLTPTGDDYSAADGLYFVDLSGFGDSSPDGALNQTIDTIGGATYAFSMDVGTGNTGVISASVGGTALVLTPGTPFTVGDTSWTPETGTFVGDSANHSPLVTIMNTSPGTDIDIVDNVSITGAAATPEPSTWAMALLGFAALGYAGYRKAKVAKTAFVA